MYSGSYDGTKGIIVKVTELATGTNTYTSAYLTGTGDNSFAFNFTASNTGAYRITIKAKRSTGTNHNFNNDKFFKVDNITMTHQQITNDLVCTSYSDYRYGFNGMEKDDEVKGAGNSYDYGARMHDSRLGRFLSVDPLTNVYPMLTPYQFASNSPIQAIDLDGLEGVNVVDHVGKTTTVKLKILYVAGEYNEEGTSKFNETAVKGFQKGLNEELSKNSFTDHRYQTKDGTNYSVKFDIQFVPVTTMEEAKKIMANEPEKTALLRRGTLRVSPDGKSFSPGSTTKGNLNLTSDSQGGHTVAHEVFHLLVHYSDNIPDDINDGLNYQDQKDWHNNGKYGGGIFAYGWPQFDINENNVKFTLEHTVTIDENKLQRVQPIEAQPIQTKVKTDLAK